MCGRFAINARLREIAEQFRIVQFDNEYYPLFDSRFNIPPTLDIPVIRQRADSTDREVVSMRWGLIPSWTKDPKKAPLLNNARSDTVAEKPSFRSALKKRRCIIPASGFFEWLTEGKNKQPFYFYPTQTKLFGFAGLWETWNEIQSCTIITTDPNEVMAPVHDRMPVILGVNDYDTWLDPNVTDIQHLLVPCPTSEVACYAVDKFVGNVKNQGEKCIEPVQTQNSLF
jgi:putative SOS response-associated peptidase YedK